MEKVCAICGVSESQAKLKTAINGRELILACSKCIEMEELIAVNKPTEEQLNYANKRYTVRETLARAMGSRKEAKEEARPVSPLTPALYCISSYRKTEFPIKLVENFHWKIMMARKAKKMSQDLLARTIGEQLITVKTIESGCITRDSERVIRKIEDALKINLMEGSQAYPPAQSPQNASSPANSAQRSEQSGKVLVTRENIRTLKVGDLIKVKEEIAAKKARPEVSMPELDESEEVIEIDDDSSK